MRGNLVVDFVNMFRFVGCGIFVDDNFGYFV